MIDDKTIIFVSYSHEDQNDTGCLDTFIKLFAENDSISIWYDKQMDPGSVISHTIKQKMRDADFIAFLLSKNSLQSNSCNMERDYAIDLIQYGKRIIPILLEDCNWKEFKRYKEFLIIPEFAKPINSFDGQVGWQKVNTEIINLINNNISNFELKDDFQKVILKTLINNDNFGNISLDNLYVFPSIIQNNDLSINIINDFSELLKCGNMIIYGDNLCGKTALSRFLFLKLVEKRKAVILLDIGTSEKFPGREYLKKMYNEQFKGDYNQWVKLTDKVAILDNYQYDKDKYINYLTSNKFSQLILLVQKNHYFTYINKELDSDFTILAIREFKRWQQEQLIRNWYKYNKTTDKQYFDSDIDVETSIYPTST